MNTNISETIKYRGDVTIKRITADGEVETYQFKNRVVDSGVTTVINRLLYGTGSAPSAISIGTGFNAVSATDVGLTSPVAMQPIISTIVTGTQVEFQAKFLPGIGTGAITEAGIVAGTTLFARTVFPVVNKLALDEIIISWVVTFSAV